MAWVFFLQRRDGQRHAKLFDRIGAEVLELPGEAPRPSGARRPAAYSPARRCSSCSRSACRRWRRSSPPGVHGAQQRA